MLCHKDPEIVRAIASKLLSGNDDLMVVHVDLKSKITPFHVALADLPRIRFVHHREAVYWGGFSSIIATVRAMKIGLAESCDRFIILQGNDWPIKTQEQIHTFFEKNRDTEFINAYNISNSKKKNEYMKSAGFYMFDKVDRSKITPKTILARLLSLINKTGFKYRRGYFRTSDGRRMDVFWGWAHVALTQACVKFIVKNYDSCPSLNKYFEHIFPPDETYFQTLVYNSDFRLQTVTGDALSEDAHQSVESMLNLTYFEYLPGKVRIFDSPDELDTLNLSNYLFVRKVSNRFVRMIESKNLQ